MEGSIKGLVWEEWKRTWNCYSGRGNRLGGL